MSTTKIVELFINDDYDESGIEAISLVSRPAHEEVWLAFNKQEKFEEVEKLDNESDYRIVSDDFCTHNPKLDTLGEPYSQLIDEGFEIIKVEKITPSMIHKMEQQRFSKPNEESELDEGEFRVRFKYVGPRDKDNRKFCAEMMAKDRVYRFEDIDDLTDGVANPQFGFYNIFRWRGSFNCRHVWVKLLYKKTGKIINDASVEKGLEGEDGLNSSQQPNTVPQNQRDKIDPREGPNATFTEQQQDPKLKMVFGFDDEKRIVVGAAMVPNKMIIRYDDLGNPFYVFFSKDSIKKMANKFLREKRTDETSVEHDGIKLGSNKVFVTESWVSEDPIKDKSSFYGFSLPSGTWYVAMKVLDDKIWKMIKEKSLTGFSVEGLFGERSMFSEEDKKINTIRKILKSIKDDK
jgi:hypothetical protein